MFITRHYGASFLLASGTRVDGANLPTTHLPLAHSIALESGNTIKSRPTSNTPLLTSHQTSVTSIRTDRMLQNLITWPARYTERLQVLKPNIVLRLTVLGWTLLTNHAST